MSTHMHAERARTLWFMQVWIFFMNVFTSLDIAANSLVASYMGRGDRAEAQRVLLRILALGVFAGACMAVLMVGGADIAPAGFTTDPGVRAAASRVFPLLGVLLVRSIPIWPYRNKWCCRKLLYHKALKCRNGCASPSTTPCSCPHKVHACCVPTCDFDWYSVTFAAHTAHYVRKLVPQFP